MDSGIKSDIQESNAAVAWFVLNYIGHSFIKDAAKKEVDRFNAVSGSNLQLFAPTYVVQEQKDGKMQLKSVRLAFHYVFVKGTLNDIKALASQSNGFSMVLDHVSEGKRYAVVSDREMNQFMQIARAYGNQLPYFSLEDIDLEDGDLVEVVNGDFPGLIGTYIPRAKSKSGNIVLMVCNKVGTVAFNIKASDVRVLEFSRNSTRANDQIDAFIPHLLKALRYYHAGEPLPAALTAKLTVFCQRMGSVRLPNPKLDAKLQALLYAAYHLLGKTGESELTKAEVERQKGYVTNEWSFALIALIFSVISEDKEGVKNLQSVFQQLLPTSKYQKILRSYTAQLS